MQPSPPLEAPPVPIQAARRALGRELAGFYSVYLRKPSFKVMAPMHAEICRVLEDDSMSLVEILGFRGSAKSTIGSTAFALWAALERADRYPFIILIADTARQAGLKIDAIKYELEGNELLIHDYGFQPPPPSDEFKDNWQAKNIVLANGVRIMAFSRGQKIRGILHREHRPKLVIVDDPEDLEWVHTQENRDKTERWFVGEVIPAMDATDSKLVLLGNLLHNDALIARIQKNPLFKSFSFPIVDDGGKCLWPAMYPTQESLDRQRDKVGFVSWQREYMLHPVSEEGQDVNAEDIHYYDELPFDDGNYLAHGVDLAISTKESADCTASVAGEVTWPSGALEIYVQPHPLNARMSFHDTMDALDNIRHSSKMQSEFFVESVQYQQAAIEELERRAFAVTPMRPIKDKRARLRVAARYIKNGTVKFPRTGCEDLIMQLLGFGIEKHDDLVDALVYLILGVAGEGIEQQIVQYV